MKFRVEVVTSSGCDYSIACGHRSYPVDADSLEEVQAKVERLFHPRTYEEFQKDWPGDEPPFQDLSDQLVDIEKVMIYEVVHEVKLDVKRLLGEAQKKCDARRLENEKAARLMAYQKLKAEFDE